MNSLESLLSFQKLKKLNPKTEELNISLIDKVFKMSFKSNQKPVIFFCVCATHQKLVDAPILQLLKYLHSQQHAKITVLYQNIRNKGGREGGMGQSKSSLF